MHDPYAVVMWMQRLHLGMICGPKWGLVQGCVFDRGFHSVCTAPIWHEHF